MASNKVKEAQGHLQAAHEALQGHFSDEKHPYASHLAHVQNNIDAALSHLNYVAQSEPDEEPEAVEEPKEKKDDARGHRLPGSNRPTPGGE